MDKRDIALLSISKIIVHDVPKHLKNDTSPQIDYSERESVLTSELKTFFKDKLTDTITKRSFKVLFNNTSPSPVPKIIEELNANNPRLDIVKPSKELAKYLFDIQKGNNPAGIVVIIESSLKGKNLIAIMKLERDEGAQLKKDTKRHVFDIIEVKNLMLTKKTKLYKAGVFFNRTDFDTDFDGYVADNQILPSSMSSIASFFIDDFLGCLFYDDTRTITKQFFELSQKFISGVEDPIKKAKYYEHLVSYINRPKNTIDSKEFILNYLEEVDRQKFEDHLKRNNFETTYFIKDNELISTHLKKIMIDFENDISIIAKNGELGNKIKLSDEGDGLTRAEIISKIKKIFS